MTITITGMRTDHGHEHHHDHAHAITTTMAMTTTSMVMTTAMTARLKASRPCHSKRTNRLV